MRPPTYFPRYTGVENVVTNTTLHLLSQINQHSTDSFNAILSELLGDVEIPLGINFQQQIRSATSVPDGSILQEPVHIIIETKVSAAVNVDQLIRHFGCFDPGRQGNFLLLLTKDAAEHKVLEPIHEKAKETGVAFRNITFAQLCDALKGAAKEHETHLRRVLEDYVAYCTDMDLLPDRRKWLRIVPCGESHELNEKWNVYYHPVGRGYSTHHFLGIYRWKTVSLVGQTAAIYDNKTDTTGKMNLTFLAGSGSDRPEFRQRIEGIVVESKEQLGWEIQTDFRFFCVEKFESTDFQKSSPGGIQGPRFWDISDFAADDPSVAEIAKRLAGKTWE